MTVEVTKPLFEDPSAPPELSKFVGFARSDGPSQQDLDRLAARLGPALGLSAAALAASSSGALGTAPANVGTAIQPVAPPAKLGLFSKLMASTGGKLMAIGLSVGIGAAIIAYMQGGEPQAAVVPQVAVTEVAPPSVAQVEPAAPAVEQPSAVAAPEPSPVSRATKQLRRPAAALPVTKPEAAPLPAAPRASELSLMQQAQAARAQPAEALAILANHQQLYPRGALAQEREVLAIELLLAQGRGADATARAAQFEANYAGSAHLPRLRALLARAANK